MSLHTWKIFLNKPSYLFNVVINSDCGKFFPKQLICIIVTVFYFMPVDTWLFEVFMDIHNSTMLILAFKLLYLEKSQDKKTEIDLRFDLRFHSSHGTVR